MNLPELENPQDKIILLSVVCAKSLAVCISNPKRVGQFIVENAIRNTSGMNERQFNHFSDFFDFDSRIREVRKHDSYGDYDN